MTPRAGSSSVGRVTAARVRMVAAVAGDQMHVRMEDRLSGVGSAIDADVVAVRPELRVDCSLAVFQEAPYRAISSAVQSKTVATGRRGTISV